MSAEFVHLVIEAGIGSPVSGSKCKEDFAGIDVMSDDVSDNVTVDRRE